jgi:hypothetical protein
VLRRRQTGADLVDASGMPWVAGSIAVIIQAFGAIAGLRLAATRGIFHDRREKVVLQGG